MPKTHGIGLPGGAVLLFAAACAAPAAAVTFLPFPNGEHPPEDPPRFDWNVQIGFEGVSAGASVSKGLRCLRSDCTDVTVFAGVSQRLRWEDLVLRPGERTALPPWLFDPFVRIGLEGTVYPFDTPKWRLSGGAVLEGQLSDLQSLSDAPIHAWARLSRDLRFIEVFAGFETPYRPARSPLDSGELSARLGFGFVGGVSISRRYDTALGSMPFLHADFEISVTDYFASMRSCIPEPQSWAMMIAGFGLVGGQIRRGRVRSRPAPA